MKEFILKYADEIGEMIALKFLHHKLHGIIEEYEEHLDNSQCLIDFHTMLEDFMRAKGIKF